MNSIKSDTLLPVGWNLDHNSRFSILLSCFMPFLWCIDSYFVNFLSSDFCIINRCSSITFPGPNGFNGSIFILAYPLFLSIYLELGLNLWCRGPRCVKERYLEAHSLLQYFILFAFTLPIVAVTGFLHNLHGNVTVSERIALYLQSQPQKPRLFGSNVYAISLHEVHEKLKKFFIGVSEHLFMAFSKFMNPIVAH